MLKTPQINAINKWPAKVSVNHRKEYWVTDGITLYRYNPLEDAFATPFDKEQSVADQDYNRVFGVFNLSDKVKETGLTFDMHLENGKGSAAIMKHEAGDGTHSLFLVNADLLTKVRARGKDKGFVVGTRGGKKILYNKDRTVGVCCIEDAQFATILKKYKDVFAAMMVAGVVEGEIE